MDKSVLDLTRAWYDDALREALAHSRHTNHSEWFAKSLTIPPVSPRRAVSAYPGLGWIYSQPDGRVQIGLGATREWHWTAGVDHIGWHLQRLREEGLPPETFIVGGQSFSPDSPWEKWPGVYFVLPTVQVVQSSHDAHLLVVLRVSGDFPLEAYQKPLEPIWQALFATPPEPQSMPVPTRIKPVPERHQFRQIVADAVKAIHSGTFEKVVMARSLVLQYHTLPPLGRILDNLQAQNPDANLFALKREDSIFFGATPELLARVQGNVVETMALAGSTPRGLTPEEDATLADAMRHDMKTRHEHAVVRQHIEGALGDVTESLNVANGPQLKRLPSVQHLMTPIWGRLEPDKTMWSVLERLHPTPAVAGFPVAQATQYIIQHEPFTRGWYAGSIGFATLNGHGEWSVALRSGIMSHDSQTIRLYAGCGIMGDSDPDLELMESDWKFKTMLNALEIEGETP